MCLLLCDHIQIILMIKISHIPNRKRKLHPEAFDFELFLYKILKQKTYARPGCRSQPVFYFQKQIVIRLTLKTAVRVFFLFSFCLHSFSQRLTNSVSENTFYVGSSGNRSKIILKESDSR